MNDTDRLIAAMYAQTMAAKQVDAGIEAFLGHFEVCMAALVKLEAREADAKQERTLLAHKAAWAQDRF
jgi:hypothetical protein